LEYRATHQAIKKSSIRLRQLANGGWFFGKMGKGYILKL